MIIPLQVVKNSANEEPNKPETSRRAGAGEISPWMLRNIWPDKLKKPEDVDKYQLKDKIPVA